MHETLQKMWDTSAKGKVDPLVYVHIEKQWKSRTVEFKCMPCVNAPKNGGIFRNTKKFSNSTNKFESEVTQPSMVTHTRNSCSAFTHPQCTHTAVNTHPEQWAAIYAAVPREGNSVAVLREHCTFTPSTDNSCRPETRTPYLLITSPTL